MPSTNEVPARQTRRSFLDAILTFCGAVTGLAACIPALIYLWPVTKKGPGGDRTAVEGAEDLGPWEATTVTLSGKPVIVVRAGETFMAYSAVCTHLGCIVHWDAQKKAFLCPCHAASFDMYGEVADGPPPAPLRPYQVSRAGGALYVSES